MHAKLICRHILVLITALSMHQHASSLAKARHGLLSYCMYGQADSNPVTKHSFHTCLAPQLLCILAAVAQTEEAR